MILSDGFRRPDTVACNGLLVIGDPHVGSRRPGRRRDLAWPGPVLAKLEHCVAVANARNLQPVLLGDLFDRPVEPDIALKSRLIRILKQFRLKPLANVGNHDIGNTALSDGDSLAMLAVSDVLDVVASAGPAATVLVNGRRLGLGFTPFGQALPGDVTGGFDGSDAVVWFTHHDIAFEGAYPGALAAGAVAGCGLVINGHMHRSHKSLRVGGTRWLNPGNITRRSVDLADHVPRAWILAAAEGDLEAVALPYEAEVFDLAGRLVAAAGGQLVADTVESAFVSLLKAEAPGEAKRSDDGTLLREEIEAKFARDGTSPEAQALLRSLLDEAVARRAG